jgi:choline-sulfatase
MDDGDEPEEITRTGTRTRTGKRSRPRTGTRTTRRLRRLDQRAAGTAPAPVAWIVGTVLGGAAGVVFHLWESLVLAAAGVPVPSGDARSTALAVTATLGAVLGAWAAAPGLYGPRWASTAAVTLAGWLAAARVGSLASDAGLPPSLGVAAAVLFGVVVGQLAGRMPAPAAAHQGLAAGLFVALAVGVPLHVSVLPGPTTPGAALTTAMIAVLALIVASGAASVARHDRAPWLPIGVGGAVALALHGVVLLRAAPRPTATEGAQVVLVVVSGLRADRLAALGAERSPTEHLDRFAATAIAYTAAHATSNWTVPSLASALTGRLPMAHGAGLNPGDANSLAPLRSDVPTVAQIARRGGVWTSAAVGDPGLRTYALDAGFARWRDDPGRGARPVALGPLGVAGLDPTGWPVRAPAEQVVDVAIDEIGAAPEGAWLLLVQLADAEAALGRSARGSSADRYDAALRRVDRALGRLLEAIPAGAWVFVVGDHGVALEEASGLRSAATSGHTMFQELLHVPLLVRAPGAPPRRVTEPVSQVDLGPTLLAALGLSQPADLDGVKLGAPFGESQRPRTLVAQASRYGPEQQMVRVGRYKLIQAGPDRTSVYDLEEDPAETSPLGTGSKDDDLRERKLRALLPPIGAGAGAQGPPGAELGRVAARLWGGRLR